MATVFWDTQGVIFVDFLSRGETVNSDSYVETLKRLQARILRVRPDMEIGNVLLLHHNAQPHTSIRTRETIDSFGWSTLQHLSYSPDLAPSDYHLFGPRKQGLRGKHNENYEGVKSAVKTWMKEQPIQFYEAGICALVKRRNVALERDGGYVEKYKFNPHKVISFILMHFQLNVPPQQTKRHYFLTHPRISYLFSKLSLSVCKRESKRTQTYFNVFCDKTKKKRVLGSEKIKLTSALPHQSSVHDPRRLSEYCPLWNINYARHRSKHK
ncbi:transposase [Elysia marginata]|uniref:Transposase n=1 Tax=Elysia marginata TaxID=1093978 RepID=A0AAV4ETP8_9GAST|nr:transposase [Elysia marginata]